MKTCLLRLTLLASGVCLLTECRQKPNESLEQIPKWVSQTHFAAHETRRVFDDNVELSVSVANTSSSPVIVEHMNRDKRVVLKGADGSESALYPFSVGVAKPLLLHPASPR